MGKVPSSGIIAAAIGALACAAALVACNPARRIVAPIQESEPPAELAERDASATPAQPEPEVRTTDEPRDSAVPAAPPPRAQREAAPARSETAPPEDRREAQPPAPPPQPKPAPPPSAPPPGSDETQSQTGAYIVEYDPEPEPIPFNKLFSLRVRVLENTPIRSPAKDVQVVADAAMPEHGHGMNTMPTTRMLRPGEYMIEGMLFHMPGQWEIYVDVTRDGVTERARFPVKLE